MKTTIKLVLFVCLFSSVAFADGEMGSGGKTCTSGCLTATQPTEKELIKSDDIQETSEDILHKQIWGCTVDASR